MSNGGPKTMIDDGSKATVITRGIGINGSVVPASTLKIGMPPVKPAAPAKSEKK